MLQEGLYLSLHVCARIAMCCSVHRDVASRDDKKSVLQARTLELLR